MDYELLCGKEKEQEETISVKIYAIEKATTKGRKKNAHECVDGSCAGWLGNTHTHSFPQNTVGA